MGYYLKSSNFAAWISYKKWFETEKLILCLSILTITFLLLFPNVSFAAEPVETNSTVNSIENSPQNNQNKILTGGVLTYFRSDNLPLYSFHAGYGGVLGLERKLFSGLNLRLSYYYIKAAEEQSYEREELILHGFTAAGMINLFQILDFDLVDLKLNSGIGIYTGEIETTTSDFNSYINLRPTPAVFIGSELSFNIFSNWELLGNLTYRWLQFSSDKIEGSLPNEENIQYDFSDIEIKLGINYSF